MAEDNNKTKKKELRKISDKELKKIFKEHEKWLKSNGKEGKPADLLGVNLHDADLRGADLQGADFREADLREADLGGAYLIGAYFQGANLLRANLQGANLIGVNLKGADLRVANFERAEVSGIEYNRRGRYRGIRVATCYGSPRFKRFAQDQDFIEEFRFPWWRFPIYMLWLILADCGRSLGIWLAWSVGLAISFGYIFFKMGPTAFHIKEPLPYKLGTMIYYSVITFTTLGFGDITPKTSLATWWVMAEVVLGYIMLGGLISILATKLARRS
jgi:uncharacterized protein YjbI with pentapeptide repeats